MPLTRYGFSRDPNGAEAYLRLAASSLEMRFGGDSTRVNLPVDGTRYALADYGRTAWDPCGTRAVFYAPMLDDLDGSANSLKAQTTVLSFNGSNVTATTAPLEPRRWPISATWSDEGERLTLIDAGVSEFADPSHGDFVDCRVRRFHVTSSRTLTSLTSDVLDPQVCSRLGTYDSPLFDGPARTGQTCLAWSPCPVSGGGGGGGVGGGGGGGGVATRSQGAANVRGSSIFPRTSICQRGGAMWRTPFCRSTQPNSAPNF